MRNNVSVKTTQPELSIEFPGINILLVIFKQKQDAFLLSVDFKHIKRLWTDSQTLYVCF